MITASKAGKSGPQTKIAIQFLLDIPPEAASRSQREAAMKSLISHLPGDSDKAKAAGAEYWKLVLSLMVKLMGRPTFYEVRTAQCFISSAATDRTTGHELLGSRLNQPMLVEDEQAIELALEHRAGYRQQRKRPRQLETPAAIGDLHLPVGPSIHEITTYPT